MLMINKIISLYYR